MRSGSTQAECTANAISTTRIRRASTPPSASASALTSVVPSRGTHRPWTTTVSPRCATSPLTRTTKTPRPRPHRAEERRARPARAPSPAITTPAAAPASMIGFEDAKAQTANEPR
jgi:hypothetical protein